MRFRVMTVLAVMRLLEMVGEETEKIPPPATFLRDSALRLIPLPFLMVKPSSRSLLMKLDPNTTTEHCVDPAVGVQKSFTGSGGLQLVLVHPRMHTFPVPSIVVTA